LAQPTSKRDRNRSVKSMRHSEGTKFHSSSISAQARYSLHQGEKESLQRHPMGFPSASGMEKEMITKRSPKRLLPEAALNGRGSMPGKKNLECGSISGKMTCQSCVPSIGAAIEKHREGRRGGNLGQPPSKPFDKRPGWLKLPLITQRKKLFLFSGGMCARKGGGGTRKKKGRIRDQLSASS